MSPYSCFLILLSLVIASNAALISDYERYVRFHWKGDLQSHSITLKVFPYTDNLLEDRVNGFVVLYNKAENQTLTNIRNFSISFVNEEYPVSQINIDSLTPETKYSYTFIFTQETPILESDFLDFYTTTHPQEFSFQTPSIALKPYNFTFGAASCAATGSISPVFNNLTDENFNFFIHMGDLHYSDIDKDDVTLFYEAYYKVFGSETQKPFFQNTPVIYNWDDHDFGGNNAIGTSPSRPAVTAAYKKFVPHNSLKNYLPADDTTAFPGQAPPANVNPKGYLDYDSESEFGIYRSFIVGRCLFIVMDLRSFQQIIPGEIMGQEQKTWIENQLRFVGSNSDIKMVFMISSVPWIDGDRGALWEDFATDQEWLGDLIEQNVIEKQKKLMMVAGDAHMVGLDNGMNNKFGGFPVVQAASLDQRPSCKGGPYSHGYNVDRGQYAVIQVTDDPTGEVCVKVDLKRLGNKLISYDTCHPELYPVSETQHCPSAIVVYLAPYGNKGYVIIGGVILGIIAALGICLYRLRSRKKKIGNDQFSKEKYNLANEENEMDDFQKVGNRNDRNEAKKEGDRLAHSEESYEMDFQGSI